MQARSDLSTSAATLARPPHLCSYFVRIKDARGAVNRVLTIAGIMRRAGLVGQGGRHMPLTKIRQSFVPETAGSDCIGVNQIGDILLAHCTCRMSPGCGLWVTPILGLVR